MSWAARRRFLILLTIGAIVVAFLSIVLISSIYKTPSCSDSVQNQEENGIDCGGPCEYLCASEVQPPIILFTKVIDNGEGRIDVIAMVENKNVGAAAKNIPYSITLYDNNQLFIQKIEGTFDLPPNAIEPIYISGVASDLSGQAGEQKVTRAFLEIDSSAPKWFEMTVDSRVIPKVLSAVQSDTSSAPRVEAVLSNPSSFPLSDIKVVALVYDTNKDVIAVSKTVIPIISALGQSVATFTWNSAFDGTLDSIKVIPIIPLPTGRQALP